MNKIKYNILLMTMLLGSVLLFNSGCKKEEAGEDVPGVMTSAASDISGTGATLGGIVNDEGGSPVTARGVCWSTDPEPTLDDNHTSDGAGTGSFTSLLTGLEINTAYFARAYAVNATGTGYGESVTFSTNTTLAVGDNYQGGIVAYLVQPGEPGYDPAVPHGLIAAPSDLSPGIGWWNGTNMNTMANGTAYGSGPANTNTIIAAQGMGMYAAKLCADLVLNGYDDWFLPAKVELNILYTQRETIGGFSPNGFYWTSTEYDDQRAWYQNFATGAGEQVYFYKSTPYIVRAVRNF